MRPSHSLREVFEVVYGLQDIQIAAPYIAKACAIAVGGILGSYLVVWLVDTLRARIAGDGQYVRTGVTTYKPRPSRSCGNLYQLFTLGFFFCGVAFSMWFAAGFVGINFWTTAMASMSIGIVLTYVFSSPLSMMGSGFALHAVNAIEVGEYWSFAGMPPGWDGVVKRVNSMSVTLERWNAEDASAEEVVYPMSHFLQVPRKRSYAQEELVTKAKPFISQQEYDLGAATGVRKPAPQPPQTQATTMQLPLSTAASAFRARKQIHPV